MFLTGGGGQAASGSKNTRQADSNEIDSKEGVAAAIYINPPTPTHKRCLKSPQDVLGRQQWRNQFHLVMSARGCGDRWWRMGRWTLRVGGSGW